MRRAWMAALLAALVPAATAAAFSCAPTDASVDTYLLVSPASRQPESPDLGTIVVVQQRGGAFLRVKTEGGTHTLSTDPAGSAGRTSSCIAAPRADSLFFFNVAPTNIECQLYVDLLGEGTSVGADCSGPILDGKLMPITTKREKPTAPDGGGGSGGMGSSSSSSSTSSSTSSSGSGGGINDAGGN